MPGLAQETPIRGDSLDQVGLHTVSFDTLTTDTLMPTADTTGYRVSENSIKDEIAYSSTDSLNFNNVNKSIELYRDAAVNSGPMKLNSGFISVNMEDRIVHSMGIPDSSGNMSQYPDMYMDRENFKAKELKYNLETSKGIILNSYREQDDLFIRSDKTKFVEEGEDKVLYNQDGIITTCDHPEPHYGIRSHKQKLVLDKIAVIGPSNIELGGIPTPLWLPFGFFPISSESTTGILFPRDYEYSDALGFGLRNIGYYVPINEYMDVAATTDIYLRGSFRVNLKSRYAKRYRYSGNAEINYASIKEEIVDMDRGKIKVSRSPSFGISISHSQDPKADPSRKFGGSVNIQTNNYRQDNFNDAQSVLQNSLNSNLSYTQLMFDNSVTLTAGLTHNQNTSTNDISITFPNVNINARRMYPFKNKERIGKEKWYEGIGVKYDAEFKAQLNTKDTLLFKRETLDTIRIGARHKLSADHTFNILKYINVRPSVDFSSAWYPYSIEKELTDDYKIKRDTIRDSVTDEILGIKQDTVEYGIVQRHKRNGFKTQNLFNATIALNTTIYGMMRFKKGWLRGLRHVIKPHVNVNFTPDYKEWGYIKEHRTDLRPWESQDQQYSIYEDGIYSDVPFNPALSLNYGIDNIFDAKIFSKRDSTEKNITLLPRLSINSGYNFVADSFKMAPVVFNGNFTLFKNFSTVRVSGGFSVYKQDSLGRRVDEYLWENGGGFMRFEGLEVEVATRFNFRQMRELLGGLFGMKSADIGKDGVMGLFDRISVNHNLRLTYDVQVDHDSLFISSHDVSINGSIPLSKNWNINIGRIGYSFQQGRITYPELGFSRDLHCWNMGFNWQPERGSYNFFIGVDPGTLDFLKMPYTRNQFDRSQTFF